MKRKILLLSAYDASSHRHWRKRLVNLFPNFEWTQLSLPPRNFSWRIRGNSLQWGFGHRELLQQEYDLLIATSMVDLSSLRGFVPALTKIPTLVYFHENQFAYPAGEQRVENIEPKLVPLYTALCADSVVFNSDYNRKTFLAGASELLQKLPEQFPASIMSQLECSSVIPVPLPANKECGLHAEDGQKIENPSNRLNIVWNHRWEYDKGPHRLLAVAKQIKQQQLPLHLHIVGEQFRQHPVQFSEMADLLHSHSQALKIESPRFGFIEDSELYAQLLCECDVVLSTALHDFQGLAVQEACLLGCTPLAPNQLVYPEYLEPQFLYSVDKKSDEEIAAQIVSQLMAWQKLKALGLALPKLSLAAYGPEQLRAKYLATFTSLFEKKKL